MLSLSKHEPAIALFTVLALLTTAPAAAQSDVEKWPMPAGFHRDAAGCFVPDHVTSVVQRRANMAGPASDISALARLADAPGAVGDQPSYHDLVTRVPLSLLLYRSGRVAAARAQWHRILADRQHDVRVYHYPAPPKPASTDLLARGQLDVLAARAEANWNPGFMDSGAGQHMARGRRLAIEHNYAAAANEWRTAIECSPDFHAPHLMLGYVAAMRRDVPTARREWIRTLETIEPAPGDMLAITNWQYAAIEALLRYT